MRKLGILLTVGALFGFLASPNLALAETLDEVLAQHFEARGGKDTIQGVKTARFTGTMQMQGGQMETPFTMEWKRPNLFRLEFTLQGQTGVQAYDGENAWMHMPFMGKTDPEMMPEEQAKDVEEQADIIDGVFINSEEKGYTIELLGKEEVEGTEAFKIKVTKENGDESFQYMDAEHFLVIVQESKKKMGESEQEIVTSFGDYKEVDGLVFPHYLESKAKGAPASQVITISSMELGVEIDDSRFVMPEVAPKEEGEEEEETEAETKPEESDG
jgi:outer membrane lipoprotein-sorting protein